MSNDIKLINRPRAGGKTIAAARWVLQDTGKRCVLVGTKAHFDRLKANMVPKKNIIMATGGNLDRKTTNFEEMCIDELGQVLSILINIPVSLVTGTFGETDEQ